MSGETVKFDKRLYEILDAFLQNQVAEIYREIYYGSSDHSLTDDRFAELMIHHKFLTDQIAELEALEDTFEAEGKI